MNSLKEAILSAIARHNGQWSWYQLDRALLARGLDTLLLMEALAALEAEEKIYAVPVAERPGMPLYALVFPGARGEV